MNKIFVFETVLNKKHHSQAAQYCEMLKHQSVMLIKGWSRDRREG